MPIGNSYPVDNNIGDKDLLMGTRSSNLATVNYAAETVAKYLNQQGKISIGGQLTFKFVDVNPISGTISLPGGGGDNTPFADVTDFIVSIFDVSFQNVVNYLDYIVGSEILLNQQNETSIFGNYKITGYTVTANPNLYNLEVEYIGGPGNITTNTFYDLSFFKSEPPTSTLTLTTIGSSGPATLISDVLNVPNYTTDLSGYVQTSRTISTTSPLQGGGDLSANRTLSILQANSTQGGYLSSTDWNTFNNKQGSITLTTTGTSGAATFAGNVINIPDYGSGYTTPTLQQVTDIGSMTTNGIGVYDPSGYNTAITSNGIILSTPTSVSYFSSTVGLLWNDENNEKMFSLSPNGLLLKTLITGNGGLIKTDLLTSALRTYQLPNASGTISLTSDPAPTLDQVLSAGNVSIIPASIGPLNSWDHVLEAYMSIQSLDNYFYATSASGDSLFYFGYGSFFLNKTNFIEARISTDNLTVSQTFDLPDASGTIALTSDIPSLTGYVPYTGATSNLDLGIYTLLSGHFLTGPAASANFTRFPNALAVISNVPSGVQHNESLYMGLMSEGLSVGSTWASGVYGAGYTNSTGSGRGTGVTGEGHVSAAADTGVAVGVRGYATDTHTGNYNIGLYGDAENGDAGLTYGGNVSLFLANGNIVTSSAAPKSWYLGGNITFDGQGTSKVIGVTNGASFALGTVTSGIWSATAIADSYISSAAVWNAKQNAITLTTTGTSGPATLVGTTLNIPQYSGGGGGSTPVKLTSQTLTEGSWTLVGSYYTYAFSNVNVTTTCDVSVTPQNASYLTAYNAQVLPFVDVAAGVATFYSQFPPQDDMVVDIVITQTT